MRRFLLLALVFAVIHFGAVWFVGSSYAASQHSAILGGITRLVGTPSTPVYHQMLSTLLFPLSLCWLLPHRSIDQLGWSPLVFVPAMACTSLLWGTGCSLALAGITRLRRRPVA